MKEYNDAVERGIIEAEYEDAPDDLEENDGTVDEVTR